MNTQDTIAIRAAGADKAAVIYDLLETLYRELGEDGQNLIDRETVSREWLEKSDDFAVYLAQDENYKPIGLITLVESFAVFAGGKYGIITELYIAPEYRSRGLGKQLLERGKAHGLSRGWHRLDVTAPHGPHWERTVNFYQKEGFTPAGPKLKFQL